MDHGSLPLSMTLKGGVILAHMLVPFPFPIFKNRSYAYIV